MADISTRFGETAFFSIRSGLDSICVARSLGRFPIQVLAIEEGDRRPLSAITSGIAMLAALPEATATRILSWDRRRAEAMGIDLKLTSERLAEARERGFVLRDGGVPPGTKAVAVSLTTSQHIPFAAISVAGTNARMDHERCLEIAAYVREKADALAAILKPPSAQTPLTPD
ncbi:IclR family transcriptional regulator domain-containing protein [Bordetella genomosp. 12]|uniref:IclR family transcriptional regulator domain-containing protein n=1 Tax=Bordetella genomosp. 12 TaxID=463035 RepID=UPI001FC9A0FF|nr:IclR family transcriptional regulator C-terminal domain-containing protein [Bordetella genomosp. 12]